MFLNWKKRRYKWCLPVHLYYDVDFIKLVLLFMVNKH